MLTTQACYIKQRQENAFAIVNDGVATGQNFIACETGMITEIGVRFATVGENTNKLQLQMATGPNTLSPEYTQEFQVKEAGDLLIQLLTPFPVEEGQQYAFTIFSADNPDASANLAGFNGNPYANGLAINQSNGSVNNFSSDMDFSVTIVEGPPPTSTQEVVTDNNLLRLHDAFPNPAFNQITIPFDLAEVTETRIEVYTLNGKLVKSIDLGLLPNGEYQELVSINDLPNGFYLYGILTPEGRLMSKITVQH